MKDRRRIDTRSVKYSGQYRGLSLSKDYDTLNESDLVDKWLDKQQLSSQTVKNDEVSQSSAEKNNQRFLLTSQSLLNHPSSLASPSSSTEKKYSRRSLLKSASSSLMISSMFPFSSMPATAETQFTGIDTKTMLTSSSDSLCKKDELKCLLDLPPVKDGNIVRIFLCRHGQTEYNRLGLVQGARIDPTLNENGRLMANRLGIALSMLQHQNYGTPKIVLHSSLQRAKETAQIASFALSNYHAEIDTLTSTSTFNNQIMQTSACYPNDMDIKQMFISDDSSPQLSTKLSLDTLSSLGEIDFGPVSEGKSTNIARSAIYETYGAWATGLIDTVQDGGGESGRSVLTRAAYTIHKLAEIGSSQQQQKQKQKQQQQHQHQQ